MVGLVGACVLGLLVIVLGVGYLLWPAPSNNRPTPQQAVAPGPSTPMAQDKKRTLDDILRDAPRNPDGLGKIQEPPPALPNRIPPRPDGAPVAAVAPMPLALAPTFQPVIPIEIKPARMSKAVDERKLPGPVDYGVFAAGGRLILLPILRDNKLVVFDVSQLKIARYIDLVSSTVQVAGGMNFFILHYPGKGMMERYDTVTLDRVAQTNVNFQGSVVALGMGCASNGPLATILAEQASGRTSIAYFDPITAKELAYEFGGEKGPFGWQVRHDREAQVRVSADGTVATAWGPGSHGGIVDVIDGARVTRHYKLGQVGAPIPSADGTILFTHNRLFTQDLQMIGGERSDVFRPTAFVPAPHGEFCLSLIRQDRGPNSSGPKAELCFGRDPKPLVSLGDMPEAETPEFMERISIPRDLRLFPVPEAGAIVAIDSRAKNRLAIYKADIDSALEKADFDYFFVSSRPPGVVAPGEVFRYSPVVRSKKSGWRVAVESGPAGIMVGNDGSINWAVPKDFNEPLVRVILKFSHGAGESFQTARIAVKGVRTK